MKPYRLNQHFCEFLYFGLKQAKAALFGGLLLLGILGTALYWPDNATFARYDFLVLYAVTIQGILLVLRLETWEEAKVIFLFHIVGTVMEIFKTHMGSWIYPEHNLLRIGGVPLYKGFMYAAVGSYIARAWRIFDLRFTPYTSFLQTCVLCGLIYLNFFTHHYVWDVRWLLLAYSVYLFGRTFVYFTPHQQTYRMPLLLGFLLVAFFIWVAENLGTFAAAWQYPSQSAAWHIVPFSKLISWYLLMLISFVLVTFVHRKRRQKTLEKPLFFRLDKKS